MGLDLRLPIGMMFSLIGLLLAGYGAMTGSDTELYKRSLGINMNVVWGIVLIVFGGLMLTFALRSAKKQETPKS